MLSSTLCDEIGYQHVSQYGTVLFLQLVSARHERASTVVTTSEGVKDWWAVLGGNVMVAALIDRPPHHCHIVNIRGSSYRMRAHQELWRSMQPRTAMPARPAGRNHDGRLKPYRYEGGRPPNPQWASLQECAIFSCH